MKTNEGRMWIKAGNGSRKCEGKGGLERSDYSLFYGSRERVRHAVSLVGDGLGS
jgi:hypothetical protein